VSEVKQKEWLALPAVSYSAIEVIEVTNKRGDKKLFRAQRWECCVRLTSVDTKRPAFAVLVLPEGPIERAMGAAFDAFNAVLTKGGQGKTGFLLSASPDLLDWLGQFPEPETPGAEAA